MPANQEEYGVVLTAKDKTRKAVQGAAAGITKIVKKYDTLTRKSAKASQKVNKDLGRMVKRYMALGVGVAAAYKTIQAGYRFVDEAVKLAGEQEAAETKLTAAIMARGLSVEETLPKLLDDAVALQRLTGAADENTLAQQALALGMGAPVEKLGDMSLALENAAAAGLPTETMLRGLAASFDGNASALTRYIPEVRNLTKEELKAGGAVDLVNTRFADQASMLRFTLPGAVGYAAGAYGDFKESLGTIIADNKTLRATLLAAGDAFLEMAADVSDGSAGTSEAISSMVEIAVDGLEILGKSMLRVRQGISGFRATTETLLSGKDEYKLSVATVGLEEAELAMDQYTASIERRKLVMGESFAVTKRMEDEERRLTDALESARQEYTRHQVMYDETQEAANQAAAEYKNASDAIDSMSAGFDNLRQKTGEYLKEMEENSEKLRGAVGDHKDLGDALDDTKGKTEAAKYAAGDFSKALDEGLSRTLYHTARAGEDLQRVLDDTADTTFQGSINAYDQLIAKNDVMTMSMAGLWSTIEGFPEETLRQFRSEFAAWMDEALNGTEATEEGLRKMTLAMQQFTQSQQAELTGAAGAWRDYAASVEDVSYNITARALGAMDSIYQSTFDGIGTLIKDQIAETTNLGEGWQNVVNVIVDALMDIVVAAIAAGAARGMAGAAAASGNAAAGEQDWRSAIAAAIAVAGAVTAAVIATIATAESYKSDIKGASGGLFAGGIPNTDSIGATVMPGELLLPVDVADAFLQQKREARGGGGQGAGTTVNFSPRYESFVPDSRIGFQRKAHEHILELEREMEILGRKR